MQEHFHKFAKFGIITACMVPILTLELKSGEHLNNLADDTTSGKDSYSSSRSCEQFKQRMRDVVFDMERLGYI